MGSSSAAWEESSTADLSFCSCAHLVIFAAVINKPRSRCTLWALEETPVHAAAPLPAALQTHSKHRGAAEPHFPFVQVIQQGHDDDNGGAVSGLSMCASLTHATTETRVQPEGQFKNLQFILISWNSSQVDLTFDLLKHRCSFKVDFLNWIQYVL